MPKNAPVVRELLHVFLTLGFIVRKFTAGGCSTMHIFFYPPRYGPGHASINILMSGQRSSESFYGDAECPRLMRRTLLIHLTTLAGELKLHYLTCYVQMSSKREVLGLVKFFPSHP